MYRLPKLPKLIWCTNYLSLSAGVSLEGAFFPVSILNTGCLSIICVKERRIGREALQYAQEKNLCLFISKKPVYNCRFPKLNLSEIKIFKNSRKEVRF